MTPMSHEQLAKQLVDILLIGKRSRGQPKSCWRIYAKNLAWSRLEMPPAELLLVARDRDAWRFQLKLLPPKPQKTSGKKEIH